MFNEKKEEYSAKQGKDIPVWINPKYEQSKAKALEIMKKYKNIGEGDFWILMNETKSGKMAYTGLIISHNACLKLNDASEEKFNPSCVTVNENGFNGSLVFTYINEKQGIYEVGEVSAKNCKNDYPYAMALKRCFDRVVLKLTKLAYDGVYSDSEADEFRNTNEEPQKETKKEAPKETQKTAKKEAQKGSSFITDAQADAIMQKCIEANVGPEAILQFCKVASFEQIDKAQYESVMRKLELTIQQKGK